MNKDGLVEGLLLFSIEMFTFTDLSRFSINVFEYKNKKLYFGLI